MAADPTLASRLGGFLRQEWDAFGRDPFNAILPYRLGRAAGTAAYPYLRAGADYVGEELEEQGGELVRGFGGEGAAPVAKAAAAAGGPASGLTGPTLESAISQGLMRPAPAYDPRLDPAQIVKEITAAATPAAMSPAKPSSLKAVRMPDGKIVFTNTDDYAGEEMSTAAAGRELRARNLASMPPPAPSADVPLSPGSERDFGPTSPLGNPVQASLRAALREAGGDQSQPGVSVMAEGLSNRSSLLEDAMFALQQAGIKQQTEVASMPAAQRAAIEMPELAVFMAQQGMARPRLASIQARENAEIAQIANDPRLARDPKAMAEAIGRVREGYRMERNNVLAELGMKTIGF